MNWVPSSMNLFKTNRSKYHRPITRAWSSFSNVSQYLFVVKLCKASKTVICSEMLWCCLLSWYSATLYKLLNILSRTGWLQRTPKQKIKKSRIMVKICWTYADWAGYLYALLEIATSWYSQIRYGHLGCTYLAENSYIQNDDKTNFRTVHYRNRRGEVT